MQTGTFLDGDSSTAFVDLALACTRPCPDAQAFQSLVRTYVAPLLPHRFSVAALGSFTFDHFAIRHLVGVDYPPAYLFGRGDGWDTLNNMGDLWNGYADPTVGKTDVLQFKAGVAPGDVTLSRTGDHLIVKINGSTDQVTISSYFTGDGVSAQGYAVEQIRFDDGTGWGQSDVKTLLSSGKQSTGQMSIQQRVNGLIEAMAVFGAPAMGEPALSSSYQQSLQPPIIASVWQPI